MQSQSRFAKRLLPPSVFFFPLVSIRCLRLIVLGRQRTVLLRGAGGGEAEDGKGGGEESGELHDVGWGGVV